MNCGDVKWIEVDHDMFKYRAFVLMVMNLRVLLHEETKKPFTVPASQNCKS
jgi:hypothetical protein